MLFYMADARRQWPGHPRGVRRDLPNPWTAARSATSRKMTCGRCLHARPPGPSPRRRPPPRARRRPCWSRGFFRQEIGSLQPGTEAGRAWRPTSPSSPSDGLDQVDPLGDSWGRSRSSWSSATSPAARSGARRGTSPSWLPALSRTGRLSLMVYVREAHPTDGWQMESNDRMGVVGGRSRRDYKARLGRGRPQVLQGSSTSASRCWSTPSTTPSAPATAACPADST